MMTMVNTLPDFYWLPNFLETILSTTIWQGMTSATIARAYRKLFDRWAEETSDQAWFVDWQGHDFSMRGISSLESTQLSGAGHLLFFNGTDSIPAIRFLRNYYDAKGFVGGSVPATEHSVMCAGSKDDEFETFKRLITETYPTGIVSIVSDTWDLWKVLTDFLPRLKDEILARDGKVVIRPDSGNPVDILCGLKGAGPEYTEIWDNSSESVRKGVVELLWDVFGGTINSKGYKELDPHIGCIYGDSITLDRAEQICQRLADKDFASTNWVAGIGLTKWLSYTEMYN